MIGNADLADVVHRARVEDGLAELAGLIHGLGEGAAIVRDATDVMAGGFILVLGGPDQGQHGVAIGGGELLRALLHLLLEDLVVIGEEVAVLLETEQVAHAHLEVGAIDGFGEELLGPEFQGPHLRIAIVERRDHDHGHGPGLRVGFEARHRLEAVHLGHHHVEDQVGLLGQGEVERDLAAGGAEANVPLGLEQRSEELHVPLLVIDYEDGGGFRRFHDDSPGVPRFPPSSYRLPPPGSVRCRT